MKKNVLAYSNFKVEGTSYLSFRDLPQILNKYGYSKGKSIIDFGCGAGRSSRFLYELGLEVTGVDNSINFLSEAKKTSSHISFNLIRNNTLPFENSSFDLAFSSHAFVMVSSIEEIRIILKEIYRVLKDGGIFILVTNSEYMHSAQRKWVSYNTDYPENYKLSSGSVSRLLLKSTQALFYDYNWLDADYQKVISSCNFSILEILNPKGKEEDNIQWEDETTFSPYSIYVCRKN